MTLVLVVAVLSAATAVLRRRTDRLAGLRSRGVGLLVVAAAVQVIVALWPAAQEWPRLAALAVSALLVALFLAANRRLPGVPLIGLGLLLNAAVVAANGAMPVSLRAAAAAGIRPADVRLEGDGLRETASDGTRWSLLGDTIPVALPRFPQVVSPGDLLVAAGVGLLLSVGGWPHDEPSPNPTSPCEEQNMAKKSRKRKGRAKSKANHGKRPNC